MKIGKSSVPYILLLAFIVSAAHFLENRKRKWNNNHLSYEIKKSKDNYTNDKLFADNLKYIKSDSLSISNL